MVGSVVVVVVEVSYSDKERAVEEKTSELEAGVNLGGAVAGSVRNRV